MLNVSSRIGLPDRARRAEENSPALERWVRAHQNERSPVGTTERASIGYRDYCFSFVPTGLIAIGRGEPSANALGYFRSSLRDFPGRDVEQVDLIPPKTAKKRRVWTFRLRGLFPRPALSRSNMVHARGEGRGEGDFDAMHAHSHPTPGYFRTKVGLSFG